MIYKIKYLTGQVSDALKKETLSFTESWMNNWSFAKFCLIDIKLQQTDSLPESYEALGIANNPCFFISESPNFWKKFIFADCPINIAEDQLHASLLKRSREDFLNNLWRLFKGESTVKALSLVENSQFYSKKPSSKHELSDEFVLLKVGFLGEVLDVHFYVNDLDICNFNLDPHIKLENPSLSLNNIKASATLNVSLDFGNHDIKDILALEVGDILISQTPINSPFSIVMNKSVIAEAHLGRTEGRKAILLATHRGK